MNVDVIVVGETFPSVVNASSPSTPSFSIPAPAPPWISLCEDVGQRGVMEKTNNWGCQLRDACRPGDSRIDIEGPSAGVGVG